MIKKDSKYCDGTKHDNLILYLRMDFPNVKCSLQSNQHDCSHGSANRYSAPLPYVTQPYGISQVPRLAFPE